MGVKRTTITELIDAAYKVRLAKEQANATREHDDERAVRAAEEWMSTVAGRVSEADYLEELESPRAERVSGSGLHLGGLPVLHEIFGGKQHVGNFERIRGVGAMRQDEIYHIATLQRPGKTDGEERVRLRLNLDIFAEWAASHPRSAQLAGLNGLARPLVFTEVIALREERLD